MKGELSHGDDNKKAFIAIKMIWMMSTTKIEEYNAGKKK